MNNILNLSKLYTSISSPNLHSDINVCKAIISHINELINGKMTVVKIEQILNNINRFYLIYNRIITYIQMNIYININNTNAFILKDSISNLYDTFLKSQQNFAKLLSCIDLDSIIEQSDYIKAHKEYLIKITFSSSLSNNKLYDINKYESSYDKLINKQTVTLNGKNHSVASLNFLIRNNNNYSIKKQLYKKQQSALNNIKAPVAECLFNIKKLTTQYAKDCNYQSVLSMSLENMHFSNKQLDTLIFSIEKNLNIFDKYLSIKSHFMNNSNKLHYYDINSPISNSPFPNQTINATKNYLINTFAKYSTSLSNLTSEIFENNYIDYSNRKNKSNVSCHIKILELKESRIIYHRTNTFQDIFSIGHEIGHAYHSKCIMNSNTAINSEIPLCSLEIGSMFFELFLYDDMIKRSSKNDKIILLDMLLSYLTQSIGEIYIRFLFEKEVFNLVNAGNDCTNEFNTIMHDCQKKVFGNLISTNDYLWILKPHYFSSEYSFYNFPYALGTLYAIHLLDIFSTNNAKNFVPEFETFLAKTTTTSLGDLSKIFKFDLNNPSFYDKAFLKINNYVNELFNQLNSL